MSIESTYHIASLRAEEKLRSLRSRLGEKSCHLLQINSGTETSEDGKYDGLFQSQRWQALNGGGAGEPEAHAPVPPKVIATTDVGLNEKQTIFAEALRAVIASNVLLLILHIYPHIKQQDCI